MTNERTHVLGKWTVNEDGLKVYEYESEEDMGDQATEQEQTQEHAGEVIEGSGQVHTTEAEVSEPEKPAKKKRKRKVTIKTEDVRDALQALGGKAKMADILAEIYGPDVENTSTTRSRVRHHIKKLEDAGEAKATGKTTSRVYRLTDKAETPTESGRVGLGDLFEVVGLLGSARVVRSVDNHQLYRLEEM